MKKIDFLRLSFVFCFVFVVSEEVVSACTQPNSPCTSSDECCSVESGRSYCNSKTKLCQSMRYCGKPSSEPCPFNDLSVAENENVIRIIKKSKKFTSKVEFPIVRKQEPTKEHWNQWDDHSHQRIAYAAVYDSNVLSEVLVDLTKESIISVESRKDTVPPLTRHEDNVAQIILNDTRVKEAYLRRGLDLNYARFTTWSFTELPDETVDGRRRVRTVPYYQEPDTR